MTAVLAVVVVVFAVLAVAMVATVGDGVFAQARSAAALCPVGSGGAPGWGRCSPDDPGRDQRGAVVIPAPDSRWLDPHGEAVTVVDFQAGQVVVQGQGVALLVSPDAFDTEMRPAPPVQIPGQIDLFGGEVA